MISSKKKRLLCEFADMKCSQCKKKFDIKKLEIHRIQNGSDGGGYKLPNVLVVCVNCHEILSSAHRISCKLQGIF